ncbi:MAG: hypothetical protein RI894_742, partial [Bacteroidota bacterium]
MKLSISIYIFIIFSATDIFAQCDPSSTNFPLGTVYTPPKGSWGYAAANSYAGEYVLWQVYKGATYSWSTCPANGAICTYDSKITVYNNNNAVIGASIAYNDDACGTQSTVVWTATFTGVVRVQLNQYLAGAAPNCTTNTTNTQVVGQQTVNPPTSYICTSSTASSGTAYTPTTSFASIGTGITGGKYTTINVVRGMTYTFSTDPTDGGAGNYDSQLAISDVSNNLLGPFNDDISTTNNKSKIVWVADFTGQIRLHTYQYPC